MTEEDSDDVTDLELFEQSVETKREEVQGIDDPEDDKTGDKPCGEESMNEASNVDTDLTEESSESPPIATEPAQRKCTECHFTAPTKEKLNKHYRVLHGGRKYKCNECKFKCLTYRGLCIHQKACLLYTSDAADE